jgi:hypothetical protein
LVKVVEVVGDDGMMQSEPQRRVPAVEERRRGGSKHPLRSQKGKNKQNLTAQSAIMFQMQCQLQLLILCNELKQSCF